MAQLSDFGTFLMKSFLRILLSIVVPLVCAFLGMLIIILLNPEVNIDEGWRLGWIGLGSGLLVGLAAVAWYWSRVNKSRAAKGLK